jgi:CRP-like cAMP-binding protein
VVLAKLKDGDVFGEVALVSNRPRNASVRATTALDVLVVSRGAFKEMLVHLSGMEEAMQEIIAKHLGHPLDLKEEMQKSVPMLEKR